MCILDAGGVHVCLQPHRAVAVASRVQPRSLPGVTDPLAGSPRSASPASPQTQSPNTALLSLVTIALRVFKGAAYSWDPSDCPRGSAPTLWVLAPRHASGIVLAAIAEFPCVQSVASMAQERPAAQRARARLCSEADALAERDAFTSPTQGQRPCWPQETSASAGLTVLRDFLKRKGQVSG